MIFSISLIHPKEIDFNYIKMRYCMINMGLSIFSKNNELFFVKFIS
jgi:hypothetical protein